MNGETDVLTLWDSVQAEALRMRQVPRATYRIQFNKTFTFNDATAQIPYLKALGISHIYASPYFQARPDSMHGYDIIDHNALNASIGSEDEYRTFVQTLHAHGMGQILDTVPNHMGIGETANHYWMDVLENGPSSPYATFFDIDWHPLKAEMSNQVLLPILGAQYGQVLENQELQISYTSGAFFLNYWENTLPLAPRTATPLLERALELILETSAPEDDAVLELQSILTALRNLPPRTETDPERIAERQREKEIIKRRLATLSDGHAPVAQAITTAITEYNGVAGEPRSFDRLDELVRSQAYRLAYWRVAAEEINYRRFFDINDLAAIRMEQPQVFEATHRLIMRLLADGSVNGLRIDHPDGLWDPAGYFRNLQRFFLITLARRHFDGSDEEWAALEHDLLQQYDAVAQDDPRSLAARPLYLVVEKILGHRELLPSAWTVDGTSGYDFLNLVNGLFVDGSNAKNFETIYSTFIQQRTSFNDLVLAKKKQIMLVSLVSEVNVLASQLSRLAERNRYVRDFTLNSLTYALREVIASFPIYRTYIADGVIPPGEVPYIENAIASTKKRNPVTDPSIFDFIRDVLLLKYPGTADEDDRQLQRDWVQKFQQVTGPVMAKGLEDTAFYIYNRLIALNEVGGEPQRFGTSVAEFHRANAERQRQWPSAMLTTSTHDTKRSEDVRARIDVLSEMPKEWRSALSRWRRFNQRHKTKVDGRSAPDRNEEYLLYQTLLGAWPFDPMDQAAHQTFVERIQAYMQKALKEAKVNTSWVNPNEAWDAAASNFVARMLQNTPNNPFLADFKPLAHKIAFYGAINAIAQTVIKLTAPGVPDIYQGNEMWDLSLVDPDNRRPVNYARHASLLEALPASDTDQTACVREMVEQYADGRIKLFVTQRLLALRQSMPDLFTQGTYVPLDAQGAHAEHIVAFARRVGDQEIVVIVPRLMARLTGGDEQAWSRVWSDATLPLPNGSQGARFTHLFTGASVHINDQNGSDQLALNDILADVPVAVLVRQ